MSYDLAAELRRNLRLAASEFLLAEVSTVVDELVSLSDAEENCGYIPVPPEGIATIDTDNYIPEVEMGGARDFGAGPVIGREGRKEQVRGILDELRGTYKDIDAWVRAIDAFSVVDKIAQTVQAGTFQADQDPGDAIPACMAGSGPCACQRRLRNGGRCGGY